MAGAGWRGSQEVAEGFATCVGRPCAQDAGAGPHRTRDGRHQVSGHGPDLLGGPPTEGPLA